MVSRETSTAFALQNVERGTHTLQAVVVDEDGDDLARSSIVSIFVHKPTLNSPAR